MDNSASREMNQNPRKKSWRTQIGYTTILFSRVETDFLHLERTSELYRSNVESEATEYSKNMGAMDLDSYCAIDEEMSQMWHDSFPNIIRATVLLAACSRLETALTNLCRIIEAPPLPLPELHVKIGIKWRDIKKSKGIYRATKFFQENFKIDSVRDAGWSQITDSNQVRNAIIHAGGELRLLKVRRRKKPRGRSSDCA